MFDIVVLEEGLVKRLGVVGMVVMIVGKGVF